MKFLITSILFLFSTAFSFGASYPDSCPSVGRTVVEALGGCSAISCSQYAATCEKCCPGGVAPAPTPAPAPIPKPKPIPTPPPEKIIPITIEAEESSSASGSAFSSFLTGLIFVTAGYGSYKLIILARRKYRKLPSEEKK